MDLRQQTPSSLRRSHDHLAVTDGTSVPARLRHGPWLQFISDMRHLTSPIVPYIYRTTYICTIAKTRKCAARRPTRYADLPEIDLIAMFHRLTSKAYCCYVKLMNLPTSCSPTRFSVYMLRIWYADPVSSDLELRPLSLK